MTVEGGHDGRAASDNGAMRSGGNAIAFRLSIFETSTEK